ncbi:holin [Mycobacterium phage Indlulamithi]|uniref:Holin n=1 Tax=Mycobacterium phage Indlulamithi TaxID=2656582 RepID=A0A649VE68_9CAUD|nr:holin [Mycobacterium phage Indlulamithi]QGJ90073.1 holin [Mycobacterium phage Indlulamithi]
MAETTTETTESGVLNFLKVNAKAVVAFVVGVILNAVNDVISGKAPWPTSLADWGRYLGTSLIGAVVVWATGNKLTEKQIVNAAVKQGVTVVTNTAIDAAASAAQNTVEQATSVLPQPAAEVVNNVAQQVSTTVTNVLKGVANNFDDVLPEFHR